MNDISKLEDALPAIGNENNKGFTSVFNDLQKFEDSQRMAKALASSTLVPKEYTGNLGNILIAMEISERIGANILAVMQNLYVVHGKPSWSSQFIIAALNSCGRFSPIRFEDDGDECYAWAYDKANNEKLTGPRVSMEMANKEGWIAKNGSKWKTMPELMRRYRAATFFGRLYAPDILMGMHTVEEVKDMGVVDRVDADNEKIQAVNDVVSEVVNAEPEKENESDYSNQGEVDGLDDLDELLG